LQTKYALFEQFDEDANGMLDQKEIGKLNATIFSLFPRMGYMGTEPPGGTLMLLVFFEVLTLYGFHMKYLFLAHANCLLMRILRLSTLFLVVC
jgi:hypothetical protein